MLKKRSNTERVSFIKVDRENIILSKKGLSAIVATLLIILLTLIAVGIVWVVVQNILQRGAEQVELGQFTLDLQIKSVQVQEDNVTLVVVKRNPGEGEFVGMNFVFSDGQNSETFRENVSLSEGDTRSFTITLTQISTSALKTVSVYPIYKLSSGRESIGNIADKFDVPANKSMGGTGTGEAVSNFAALGFTGAGETEYSISSGSDSPVQFKNTVIDPLDVQPGQNQTLTVRVKSTNGIANVTATTQLDNELLVLNLTKTGEEDGYDVYSVTWTVYDTHVTTYRTTFTATDSLGNQNSVTLTWTDQCSGINHGFDSTLSTSCTIGIDGVSGIDGGSLTIASEATLTLNSNSLFAWNSGKSITVTGSIATSGNGALIKRYMFYTDSDGDLYGASAGITTSTGTPISGFVRVKDAAGTNDCCDSDANAKPGQTAFFTTARTTCGGFDYNCVSGEEKEFTSVNGACRTCFTGVSSCVAVSSGSVGYESGTSPACGSSGTYVSTVGASCLVRDQIDCEINANYGCSPSSRTQSCR